MKLNPKTRLFIVGGIGLALVLFGVAQAIFKLQLPKKIVDEVSFFMMLLAFGLLLSGRKKENPPADSHSEDDEKKEE